MLAPGDLCRVLAEVQHLGVGWVVVAPYGTPLKLILQIFLLLTGPLIKEQSNLCSIKTLTQELRLINLTSEGVFGQSLLANS